MNAMKEDLQKRRAELGIVSSPFYGAVDRALTLEVKDSAGDAWILPWNHFLCSRHDPSADDAPLVLTFVAHQVLVSGVNLDAVTQVISKQRLAWLRAVPGKYLKTSGDGEPTIEAIKVVVLRKPIVTE